MLKRRLPFLNSVMSGLLFLVAIAGLNGCGGGGGGSSSTPTPTPVIDAGVGYFDNGTADVYSDTTNTSSVHISDLDGFVSGNQIMLVSPSTTVAWFATITSLNGSTYTADVKVYKGDIPTSTAKMTGTLNSGASLSGTLTGQGYGEGTFNLTYSMNNGQQANLTTIMRTGTSNWTNIATLWQSSFNIDNAGNVTNNSIVATLGFFSGCQINGTVSAIANSALYKMQIAVSQCKASVGADGNYSGYITTTTQTNANDTLIVTLIDNSVNGAAMYGVFK